MNFIKINRLMWYIKSDIKLRTTTVWGIDGVERIDGFYFLSKKPLSRTYQRHPTIGLENTYNILELIRDALKEKKKAIVLEITGGFGVEKVIIWEGSLKKAERLIFGMIKEIQKQY